MTTRTFKQFGIAFGSQTANITAKIDDAVVYQGPVTTLDESYPSLPNLDYVVSNELFTWTANVDFSGPQTLEISIDENAVLLVADIQANYTPIGNVSNVQSSGANVYVGFAYNQFGNTYINGELVPSSGINHSEPYNGQWWFQVPSNGNFVENFTVEPGLE